MIDVELIELGRALMLAAERLDSDDFRARQARLREIEAEHVLLAEGLEADEAAVMRAQEAIQAHYLKAEAEVILNDDTPFPECVADLAMFDELPEPIVAIDDEYATPRPNGADGETHAN
jgi:hypothetical protein